MSARTDEGTAAVESLAVPRDLRVVSYYPADAGWTRMWEPWRPARLAADLHRLRSLNANTVRIVVSPSFFGYPDPEQKYVDRLDELVSIAAAQGLHVQLTLFDWWGDYADVAGSKEWAGALLRPYVGDPRVAFVELRNEIDPADAEALAWARELVPWLRALLGRGTRVTLSVAGMNPLRDLRVLAAALPTASRPDFFSAHYFTGGGERATDVFRRLRTAVFPTPLWVAELGYPTSTTVSGFDDVPLTSSAQEAAQAHYLLLCFAAARRAGLALPGVWILDDFAPGAIPISDVSPKEPEYTFGLFRLDGSEKPAAATLRRLFAGARETGFNGGFEEVVQGTDGAALPATWSVVGGGITRSGPARTGRASVRIIGSGSLTVAPVDGAVREGKTAVASAWLSGRPAGGSVRLSIAWFDDRLRRVRRAASLVHLPLTRGWTPVSVSGRPSAGAVFARIAIEVVGLRSPVWVDDVAFSWR